MFYRGCFFFFQAEDGIRVIGGTGVRPCALPIFPRRDAVALQESDGVVDVLRPAPLPQGGVDLGAPGGPALERREPRVLGEVGDRPADGLAQIGRASCRDRVQISVVAVSLKKNGG